MKTSFADLSAQVGAEIGLTYAPLNDSAQVNFLGDWSSGPAWSTIKVPLALALLRETDWSLTEQARFLARIACDPGAAPVTDLMGQIASGQQWGLGAIDGAYFKGGWGPGADGLYLVRQFGVVPTPSGRVAVAIAAVADTGGFGDGTAVLNRVAEWLQNHLGQLGGGECPPR